MSEIHLPPVGVVHCDRALRIIGELSVVKGGQIELSSSRAIAVVATLLASVDYYKAAYEHTVDAKTDLDGECISLALRLSDVGRQHKTLRDAVVRFVSDVAAALKPPVHHSNG